nr:MAG TPA: hypothetical protein [Caudoviricetes sp.]
MAAVWPPIFFLKKVKKVLDIPPNGWYNMITR